MAAVIACGLAALPSHAFAWWRGGVTFGFGFTPFYAPPVYVPPPVYYYPPPVYPAPVYPPPVYPPPVYPPSAYSPPAGAYAGPLCYAGRYTCPLGRAVPAGAACSCPGEIGRIDGRAG